MPEAESGFEMQAAFHRTTVELGLVHTVEHGAVDFASAAHVKNADYSAHGVIVSFRFNLVFSRLSYSAA